MKNHIIFLLFCIIVIVNFSCRRNSHSPPVFDENPNKCFSFENYYDEYYYTDSIIVKTGKGNHLMKVSISDTTYVLYCGRDGINYEIGTFKCSEHPMSNRYKINWETESYLELSSGCGTCCWTNYIYPLVEEKEVIVLSYSAMDTVNLEFLTVLNDTFLVENIVKETKIYFPIEAVDCQVSACYSSNIDIVSFQNGKVRYTSACDVNKTINEQRLRE